MMRCRHHWLALATLCARAGCEDRSEPQAKPHPVVIATPATPVLPVSPPRMDREALLLAVTQVASEAAMGVVDEERQRQLDGSRFELRLRFGCPNQPGSDEDPPRSWKLDEKRRVLSWRIDPEMSGDDLPAQALGERTYEAVEGFWIHRPWLLKAACPAVRVAPSSPPNPPQAVDGAFRGQAPAITPPYVGIAQFFTQTDARTHRRDKRAYTATKALGTGETLSADGYDLVISGRLRRLDSGRVIACDAEYATRPPRCIISAQFDSVAIETPGTGEVIAKWSSS